MYRAKHDHTLSRNRLFGGGSSTGRLVKRLELCQVGVAIPLMLALVDWMSKELENGKLCARGTVVISGHSLSPTVPSNGTAASNNEAGNSCVKVPKQVRARSCRFNNFLSESN